MLPNVEVPLPTSQIGARAEHGQSFDRSSAATTVMRPAFGIKRSEMCFTDGYAWRRIVRSKLDGPILIANEPHADLPSLFYGESGFCKPAEVQLIGTDMNRTARSTRLPIECKQAGDFVCVEQPVMMPGVVVIASPLVRNGSRSCTTNEKCV
jgi:hypothetical protein